MPTSKAHNPRAATILEKADAIINGDREKTYGDPGRNVRCIASFWNLYLNEKYDRNIHIKPEDVCAMMRFLKESRLINSPHDEDTLMDIAGYVGLAERIRTPKIMQHRDVDFHLSDTTMMGPGPGRPMTGMEEIDMLRKQIAAIQAEEKFPVDNPDIKGLYDETAEQREMPDRRRG